MDMPYMMWHMNHLTLYFVAAFFDSKQRRSQIYSIEFFNTWVSLTTNRIKTTINFDYFLIVNVTFGPIK